VLLPPTDQGFEITIGEERGVLDPEAFSSLPAAMRYIEEQIALTCYPKCDQGF
jgi:hypothetical protein